MPAAGYTLPVSLIHYYYGYILTGTCLLRPDDQGPVCSGMVDIYHPAPAWS